MAGIVSKKAELLGGAVAHILTLAQKPVDPEGASFVHDLARAADLAVSCLREGGKVLAAGNGGSAAEAQHLTGEIVGRFRGEKPALPAVCLHGDSSTLTAVGNDYGYQQVFARQVEALGKEGDVLFLLSTSGKSANLLEAAKAARSKGVVSVALVGVEGGELASLCDVAVRVPSHDPQTVQELHLFAVHCLAWAIEEAFGSSES